MYFSPAPSSAAPAPARPASPRPLRLILQAPPAHGHASTQQSAARKAARTSDAQPARPCLRPSVQCGRTARRGPAATPRFVHFSTDLEHIRWFCKAEPPVRAACDHSPHTPAALLRMTPIRPPAPAPAPAHRASSPVALGAVGLAGRALCGTINVHNIAFEKQVFVRMTTDEWRSFADVPAVYRRSVASADGRQPSVDRFDFTLPAVASTTDTYVSLCVCYRVGGREYWDNNQNANYLFKLSPSATPSPAPTRPSDAAETLPYKGGFCFGFDSRPNSGGLCFGFDSRPTRAAQPPAAPPGVAQRYMQYSEARFSVVADPSRLAHAGSVLRLQPEPAAAVDDGAQLSPPSQWSSSHLFGSAQSGDFYRTFSPLRASSPLMCAGSPLAASHAWPSLSATVLHC